MVPQYEVALYVGTFLTFSSSLSSLFSYYIVGLENVIALSQRLGQVFG